MRSCPWSRCWKTWRESWRSRVRPSRRRCWNPTLLLRTQDWPAPYFFRWVPRMGRYVSFWKRLRKVGFKGIDQACIWTCQGSRSTSSWWRWSSLWRWRSPPTAASWRTRRKELKGGAAICWHFPRSNESSPRGEKLGQYFYINGPQLFCRVSRKFSKSLANGGRGVAGDASSDSSSDTDNDHGYKWVLCPNNDNYQTFRSVDATDGRRNVKKSSYSYSSSANMRWTKLIINAREFDQPTFLQEHSQIVRWVWNCDLIFDRRISDIL